MSEGFKRLTLTGVIIFSFSYGLSSFAFSIPNPTLGLLLKHLSHKLPQHRDQNKKDKDPQDTSKTSSSMSSSEQPNERGLEAQSGCSNSAQVKDHSTQHSQTTQVCPSTFVEKTQTKPQRSISGL